MTFVPRFAHVRMSNPEDQYEKLHGVVVRSTRNSWAESIEEKIRDLCPLAISYDICASQPEFFREFAYTEICGGFWAFTQSLKVNILLMKEAATHNTDKGLDDFVKILGDKYILDDTSIPSYDRVCFLPGHNMLDVCSQAEIARLVFDEPDVMFKPHPLTEEKALAVIANKVGAERVIDKNLSGYSILNNCSTVYTTAASEMAITGTALGKRVYNVGDFFTERRGAYLAVSKVLFRAHITDGVKAAQQLLANMIHCEWSGLLFPWQEDYEHRASRYFKTIMAERAKYINEDEKK